MSDDLYRPPESEIAPPTRGKSGQPGRIDIGLCFSDGWDAMVANLPLWLGAGLVYLLLLLLSTLTLIGIFLLVPVLAFGMVFLSLRMFDGEGRFADLFAGFGDYGFALITSFLVIVLGTLIGFIGQIPAYVAELIDSTVLRLLGVLVNIAWGFAVSYPLSFAFLFVVDQRMGAVESLQASWDHTRGQTWLVVGLVLLSGLVMLGGALLLLIGIIPASAIVGFAFISAYRQMTGTRRGSPREHAVAV